MFATESVSGIGTANALNHDVPSDAYNDGATYPPERRPSQTYHKSHVPITFQRPSSLIASAAVSGGHYAGIHIDHADSLKHSSQHSQHQKRLSQGEQQHHDHQHPQLSLDAVKQDHLRVLADLNELYACRPSRAIFERSWSPNAVFEDPLVTCRGFREYAAQWYALAKLISRSKLLSQRILASTDEPNRLVYTQQQEYTLKLGHRKKIVNSIVTVEFGADGKVIRLLDEWDAKPLSKNAFKMFLRRANARLTPIMIRAPAV